jgi:hypothetical protein
MFFIISILRKPILARIKSSDIVTDLGREDDTLSTERIIGVTTVEEDEFVLLVNDSKEVDVGSDKVSVNSKDVG